MKHILLAGPSAAGKSTLAKALCYSDKRVNVSTSKLLKHRLGDTGATSQDLFEAGNRLDANNATWISNHTNEFGTPTVVDAIRSKHQNYQFGAEHIRVNVICSDAQQLVSRWDERARGKVYPSYDPYYFDKPDFIWDSSRVSLTTAVTAIEQLANSGSVDIIFGGQYGSEGKGKLAALLANGYSCLVRSGGPNAGHWVRDKSYEYCFHHIPSGALANKKAIIAIAAGATLGPGFIKEVEETDVSGRLWIDRNAVIIEDSDREAEGKLVDIVGSTAQGVGSAASRRILRGLNGSAVRTVADVNPMNNRSLIRDVSSQINHMLCGGHKVMIEGTQGSALSLYHGEYPFVTSRDTNIGGLLSETGIAPSHVRDVWMVIRTYPIRVGGNSGPFPGETTWEEVAKTASSNADVLRQREHTSTTKRLRRVGVFDRLQLGQAVAINRPNRFFVTFADYLTRTGMVGITEWSKLPDEVLKFTSFLEEEFGIPVAGVSTGRMQSDVVMRQGFIRQ